MPPTIHNECASYMCINCGELMEVSSRSFRSICPSCGNNRDCERDHDDKGLTPVACRVLFLDIAGRDMAFCVMEYACWNCKKQWTDRPAAVLHCNKYPDRIMYVRQYPPVSDGNYAREAYCHCDELHVESVRNKYRA